MTSLIAQKLPVGILTYSLALLFSLGYYSSFSQEEPDLSSSETIVLDIDQPFYTVGETLTYHAYVFHPDPVSSNSPVSNYAYIDFVDSKGDILHHDKIKLVSGVGKGEVLIDRSTDQGYYRIFAYTAAMPTDDNTGIFEIEIPVYDVSPGTINNIDSLPQLYLFAEGGSLLAQVPGRLAYLIKNKPASNYLMELVDSNGNHVQNIVGDTDQGYFDFTPGEDTQYQIIAFDEVYTLPNVKNEGASLKVRENGSKYYLDIRTRNIQPGTLLVTGESCGSMVLTRQITLDGNNVSQHTIEFEKITMPTGVIKFKVSTGNSSLASRVVLNIPQQDIVVNIDFEKDQYGKNEDLTARVSLQDVSNTKIKSVLSASVVKANGNMDTKNPYLDFLIASQSLTRENMNLSASNDLSMMMRTTDCTGTPVSSKPEVQQIIKLPLEPSISGDDDQLGFILAYFIEDQASVEIRPDNGNAILKLPDLEQDNHVWFYGFDNFGKRLGPIQFEQPEDEHYRIYKAEDKSLILTDNAIIHYLNQMTKLAAIKKVYGTPVEPQPQIDTRHEPDDIIYPDVYDEIETMKDFVISVVTKASVKGKKGRDEVYLTPTHSYNRFRESPLYFINEIPTFNGTIILSLDLDKIDHVEVFNSLGTMNGFGIAGRNGVFKVVLKNNVINPLENELQKMMQVDGLSFSYFTSSGFTKPSESEMIYPDFRTLLFTSQPLRSDASGVNIFTFKTSDVTGDYQMIINGITEAGKFFSKTKSFQVLNQ